MQQNFGVISPVHLLDSNDLKVASIYFHKLVALNLSEVISYWAEIKQLSGQAQAEIEWIVENNILEGVEAVENKSPNPLGPLSERELLLAESDYINQKWRELRSRNYLSAC